MSSIAEPIWFEQPSILFENEKLTEFIPLGDMPFANKMNSMVRLSIYFSLLWFFYDFNNDALYIPLFIMLMTYLLYTHLQKCLMENFEENLEDSFSSKIKESKQEFSEKSDPENCTAPTENNPFMNVMLTDIVGNPNRPSACKDMEESTEDNFKNNLFQEVSDVFGKHNSQRQYCTNPSTTIPNDAIAFAKWCNNVEASCKGDYEACEPYGLRYHHGKILDERDKKMAKKESIKINEKPR
jgi:hypothetical protein